VTYVARPPLPRPRFHSVHLPAGWKALDQTLSASLACGAYQVEPTREEWSLPERTCAAGLPLRGGRHVAFVLIPSPAARDFGFKHGHLNAWLRDLAW
jgi:hypothetical protein